jgi:hypothetical protein
MRLKELNLECGSEKSTHEFGNHNLLDTYDCYFNRKRESIKKILEVGILDGASIRLWKKYFTQAHIYGLDINPNCKKYEDDRVTVFIGSQADNIILTDIKSKISDLDIIIDDGSHINEYTKTTFTSLFPLLKSGGVYVIEDLHCCYENIKDIDVFNRWPGMKYNPVNDIKNNTIDDIRPFFNKFIDDMNMNSGEVLFVHFWPRICIIGKK